jgi:IclR family transcriptional regulator, acetate operon repressor
MAPGEAAKIEGAETARRALRLMEAVVTVGEPIGLAELAELVGLSRSTCYRLVRVLQDELYLERLDSGGYRVGSRLVGVAAAVLSQSSVYTAARPALRVLADAAGETATLHVRSGNRAVLVMGVESTEQALRRAATIGESTPLTRGSSGQAILAHLHKTEAGPIVARAEDPAALRAALNDIRAAGYALSYGANHAGVHGIAAPIPSTFRAGAPVSVAVSGPGNRWDEERMRAFSARLIETCGELSALFADALAPLQPA